MEDNYISAESYVLGNTMQVEHQLLIYPDGRKELIIEADSLRTTLKYLQASGFQFKSIINIGGQYQISF